MKKLTWRKHHKWFGLVLCFFLLMFCLSGIVLNHRRAVSGVDVSRSGLLARYRHRSWSGGLLRGTLALDDSTVLVYGSGGLWLTTREGTTYADFNDGLPRGADRRNIRSVVRTADGRLFAAGNWGLYVRHLDSPWTSVNLPAAGDERLTDLTLCGDSLVLLSRSYLYLSVAPFTDFRRCELKASADGDGRVTLFRTVWLLHSGELFGRVGQTVVDIVALLIITLCVTGFLFFVAPKWGKWRRRHGHTTRAADTARRSLLLHDRIGRVSIVLTILVCLTGWCLRPPAMIPLAIGRVKPVPGSKLDSRNPWHDKLRMIRRDTLAGDWLVSTSEGFFAMSSFDEAPRKLTGAPPVSVMGLNVWQVDSLGRWICGSFSGVYVWERATGRVSDYYTGTSVDVRASRTSVGSVSASGFTSDMACGPTVVDYSRGAPDLVQPRELSRLPMSLWNFALEVHSGRFYLGSAATLFFVFFAGGAALWCLWTGWKVRRNIRGKGRKPFGRRRRNA